jgi:hypothetical protein
LRRELCGASPSKAIQTEVAARSQQMADIKLASTGGYRAGVGERWHLAGVWDQEPAPGKDGAPAALQPWP